MQEQVSHMVTTRGYSTKLANRHVRQPDQRIPVATFHALECPNDPRPRQPFHDHRCLINIERIIEIDEAVAVDRPITGQDAEGEKQSNQPNEPSLPITRQISPLIE